MRLNIQASTRRLVHADMVNKEMSQHPDGGSRPIATTLSRCSRSKPDLNAQYIQAKAWGYKGITSK